ncbi:L,D-transpeptidase family protein [Citreimonas salinaria]|uniref:Lipoprotein-anchoring transpeptidase ErfK/SrfK n=1 Tax=Citreimonas salinaria TaxID=321339 RepID=A0A1H3ND72_9RHOB|nr:L,D-transpeptidase [Citreimonas salinaria]SDY86846.1 Lipoprotein-anchoring transpeptidase ErfK/SrfK [Citreimonas salinaria]
MKVLSCTCAALACVAPAAALVTPGNALAQPNPDAVAQATYESGPLPEGQSAITVVVQVLLDRAAISPGVIDGWRGPMSRSAIRAFEAREGLEPDGRMDRAVWDALGGSDAGDVLRSYRITEDDASGLSEPLPEDYSELAARDWLGYTRVSERLAEKFHMDEGFLLELNPGAAFAAGETLVVAAPGERIKPDVTRVEVRKAVGRVAAFDDEGTMVANYPATVGSDQLPSPSGRHEVEAIAIEPTYTYKPDKNFQQMDNTETLRLPPGPNGPVGDVWIDLSKPTYGIHGTSEPDVLFQSQSHGCVRLTNWDARELAGMVTAGIPVIFVEGGS